MKVKVCQLPCIVAKITVNKSEGTITYRCPKDCHFTVYEERQGPIDKWVEQ